MISVFDGNHTLFETRNMLRLLMFYEILKPHIKSSTLKSYKKGETIYLEGDRPNQIYLINEGLVGLFNTSEGGKETFLRVFNKNSIFGHRSYFADTPYHATTVALVDSQVSIISTQECDELCRTQPMLLKEVTKILARDLGNAELRLAGFLDKSANKRIVESLVYFKLKHPEKIWTRKEVAEYSGSTYETVARVMTILVNNKLIEKNKRDFDIHDVEELLKYSREHF